MIFQIQLVIDLVSENLSKVIMEKNGFIRNDIFFVVIIMFFKIFYENLWLCIFWLRKV